MAVMRVVGVDKLIPERPKIFPSFTQDEAEQLWGIVVDACAHGASDRPDSTTIQCRLHNIRQRTIQPSADCSAADSVSCTVANRLTDGNGEYGEKNEVQLSIIGEAKNRLLDLFRPRAAQETEQHEGRKRGEEYQVEPQLANVFPKAITAAPNHSSEIDDEMRNRIDRLPEREYDDPQRPRAHSVVPPPSRRQTYDARPDPRASAPRRQSTSVVPANPGWTLPPRQAAGQAPYYTQEAFGAHAYIEPRTRPPMSTSPPLGHWGGYQLRPPHSPGPYDSRGQYRPPQPPYGCPATGYSPGPGYVPGPGGATVDPNISKSDPYARHPSILLSPWPDPGRSDMQITYTDDTATKLTQYLRRRCFNCRVTEPPGWRKSILNPGKIVRAT
ncbi:hypothetical protein FRC09_020706 [Ceratobasidium sp. 395]|nr:hypothetical protein FRC09_020706 [Ceratobasidium sp. 395]